MRHPWEQLIARIEHRAEEHHLRRLAHEGHEPVPEVGDVVALLETAHKRLPPGMLRWLLYVACHLFSSSLFVRTFAIRSDCFRRVERKSPERSPFFLSTVSPGEIHVTAGRVCKPGDG